MILVALFGAGRAWAADVFVSIGADGVPRYSTEARERGDHRLFSEEEAPHKPVRRRTDRRLMPVIDRVAKRHGLSPDLVRAVAETESALNPHAISPRGARGAMQLMPATGASYGLKQPADWMDPERNIDAGARYLKDLLRSYGGNVPLALAAYNAGPGAVAKHGTRIPPYGETMLYVPSVLARAAAPGV